jgi:O-antigen/teichoic acid export membrane protein
LDKALQIGKTSATGSFHLLIGVAGSTIIMAIGTLIIVGLLPVNEVGLYGIAFIPSTMINYFRDFGVNYAMTQQIASLRATDKESEIHDVIVSGTIFEFITGAILSLIIFAIAEPLALVLSPSNAANLSIYIAITSMSVFAGAIIAAAIAIFTGFERMKLNSLTQILQAIVKTALGPFLIIIGFGVLGAIYATIISLVAGAIIGIVLVYFLLFRSLQRCKVGKFNIKQTLKPMLKFGLPLTVSYIIIGVIPQVFAFSMAVYAGEWMMGNYYAAVYFFSLLSFISVPVTTVLFPVFSKLNPEREPELVKTVFASSVKYTAILLVPATMVLITLSTPLINFLFPQNGIFQSFFVANPAGKFPYAPLFLALSSVFNLLVLMGNIIVESFQTGIGKTNQIMKQNILYLTMGLPLAYILVSYLYSIGGPSYAVIGGIIGTLIAFIPGFIWAIHWSWKRYGVRPDFRISAKVFAASTLASLGTYLFITAFSLPNFLTLVGGFAVFLVLYLVTAPLIGAVNLTDIDNFKVMFSSLGVISTIIDFPLMFMREMCVIKNFRNNHKF